MVNLVKITSYIVLIICLIISVYTDLKYRKILNKITLPMIIFGIVINLFIHSNIKNGILFSSCGILTASIFLIIPFLMGGLGAGDLKLLIGVGAITGFKFTFDVAIYMSIIGAILAIVIIIYNKVLNDNKTIPYGVAIALGSIIEIITTL